MGRAANVIDWTEETPASRVDSEIWLVGARSWDTAASSLDEDDEPTRPHARGSLPPLAPSGPISELNRATGCTVTRLAALLEWIAQEDATSEVANFVAGFLSEIGALGQTLNRFAEALEQPSSPTFGATGEALLRAIGLWRASVVDHVDELALTQHGSLEGWSSLPEYSATYTLAFVQPALDAMHEWAVASPREGEAIRVELRDLAAAVARTNEMLRRAAPERSAGVAPRPERGSRVIAW